MLKKKKSGFIRAEILLAIYQCDFFYLIQDKKLSLEKANKRENILTLLKVLKPKRLNDKEKMKKEVNNRCFAKIFTTNIMRSSRSIN